ncbi:MAG: hypothetical protein JO162_04150, partial [Alphaproteobacteria bacterium]|nr:hypothetical protein [Alphaproteobacteria bacterium]
MLLRVFGVAGAALLLLTVAAGARADGLERFDKLLKPKIPPDSMVYKSAKALG